MTDEPLIILPAVLGWSNEDTGPENTRLYALDQGGNPRWAKPHARVAEQALREHPVQTGEGDRYLVVRIGSRFTKPEDEAKAIAAFYNALRPVD